MTSHPLHLRVMGFRRRFVSLCLLAGLSVPAVFAQEAGIATPIEFQIEGNTSSIKKAQDYFYPRFEVRSLNDLPVNVLITEIDGERTFGPAVGLDVFALWVNFNQPKPDLNRAFTLDEFGLYTKRVAQGSLPSLQEVASRIYTPPSRSMNLAGFVTANAAYTTFSLDGDQPANEDTKIAEEGLFASVGTGIVLDARWMTRGGTRVNRVRLGGVVRGGWFSATESFLLTYGPVLSISVE